MSVLRDPDTEIIWVTEDGERVILDQMAAGHLLNCYSFLRRRLRGLKQDRLTYAIPGTTMTNPLAEKCARETIRGMQEAEERFKITLDMMRAEIERRGLLIMLRED